MKKSLIYCDRVIYGALLGMIFVLPYSLALIAVSQAIMTMAWITKNFILSKEISCQQKFQDFNKAFGSMVWPMIALAILIALTIPFSHLPLLSLRKLLTRFLQQIFLAFLVTEIVQNRKRLYTVLGVLLLTLFFVSIDVMIQYYFGKSFVHHTQLVFGRVSGPMNHPNDLGTLLVTVLPVVLVLAISCPLLWLRGVILILFLILVTALGLTSSRGAWLAFVLSMLALGIFMRKKGWIISIVIMLVLFLGIFGMYCLGTRLDLYSVPMYQGSLIMKPSLTNPWGLPAKFNAWQLLSGASGRETYWDTAFGVIKHNPWFGCGYSGYVQTLKDYHVGHEEYPHNSLLHITAELGLVGLFLYFWLFVATCQQALKVLHDIIYEKDLYILGCGASCGILAWMVHSQLDTPWSSLQLSLILWLLIGIMLSLGFVVKSEPKTARRG